jgi:hypothetical protein
LKSVTLMAAFAWLPAKGAATEIVTLKTGFSLRAERHRADGDQVILDQSGGSIRVLATDVASIEIVADDQATGGASGTGPGHQVTVETFGIVDRLEAQRLLTSASDAVGLPAAFVLSVAHVESAFVADAKSKKGAVGLMQLMPGTANALGVTPSEPNENAIGGARYLRDLLVRYGGDARLALAAYNAGPGAVDHFGGVPPFRETQLYIDRVLREYAQRLNEQTGTSTTAPDRPRVREASETPRTRTDGER